MDVSGKQMINCSVSECKFYKTGEKCSLNSIKVVSPQNEDQDSMCGSFQNGNE